MTFTDPFPTYAQHFEDIILLALLTDIKKGFYVDVGANYPTIDSVTKLFYDKGWTGINIEPLPSLHSQLINDRPKDINLQIGISDKPGEMDFFENVEVPGHSSLSLEEASHQSKSTIITHKIKIKTLTQVFDECRPKGDIHFLKVDVEGLEEFVIAGNNWKKYRPFIICIEANHRKTNWYKILEKNNYKLFINDGLNEYYIASEKWALTDDYADKVVEISYHALKQHQFQSWKDNVEQLEKITLLNQTHHDLFKSLESENKRLHYENRYSLINKSHREKIKLIVKALAGKGL